MSYILDALQRTETTGSAPSVIQPPAPAAPSLTLPWKLAIGAILLLNVVFVSFWLGGRATSPAPPSAIGSQNFGGRSDVNTYATANQRGGQNGLAKRTLPGILSPKPAPPPTTGSTTSRAPERATSSASDQIVRSATERTFKPSGTKITIAEPGNREAAVNSSTEPEVSGPVPRKKPETVSLSQLSDSAREALYVLTFSTHIYGSDADLRAVVVNGQRLTEGNSVTADNGQEFSLQEITEDGVILQFEHDGETKNVQIPAVMENWQDG